MAHKLPIGLESTLAGLVDNCKLSQWDVQGKDKTTTVSINFETDNQPSWMASTISVKPGTYSLLCNTCVGNKKLVDDNNNLKNEDMPQGEHRQLQKVIDEWDKNGESKVRYLDEVKNIYDFWKRKDMLRYLKKFGDDICADVVKSVRANGPAIKKIVYDHRSGYDRLMAKTSDFVFIIHSYDEAFSFFVNHDKEFSDSYYVRSWDKTSATQYPNDQEKLRIHAWACYKVILEQADAAEDEAQKKKISAYRFSFKTDDKVKDESSKSE